MLEHRRLLHTKIPCHYWGRYGTSRITRNTGARTTCRNAWITSVNHNCGQWSGIFRRALNVVGVKLSFLIRPGKPVENTHTKSINGESGGECPNKNWFLLLCQAKILIEQWCIEYNTERSHNQPGYLTPEQFARAIGNKGRAWLVPQRNLN